MVRQVPRFGFVAETGTHYVTIMHRHTFFPLFCLCFLPFISLFFLLFSLPLFLFVSIHSSTQQLCVTLQHARTRYALLAAVLIFLSFCIMNHFETKVVLFYCRFVLICLSYLLC